MLSFNVDLPRVRNWRLGGTKEEKREARRKKKWRTGQC